jgi:hypothetical protein
MDAPGSSTWPVDPRQITALLADPVRLRVFAALVLFAGTSPAQTARLAEAAGTTVRETARALARFEEFGFAIRDANAWRATTQEALAAAMTSIEDTRAPALPALPMPTEADAAVLRGFFADGRLVHLPAQRTKQLVVLDYLAQAFEPGVRYPEAEVNDILAKFHDDFAALRRFLVDAGLLTRSAGVYWRSGG